MVRSIWCGLSPRPTESEPCGSKSTSSTLRPYSASEAPRLMVVVVLPTPPFWLHIEITRAWPWVVSGRGLGQVGHRPAGRAEHHLGGRLGVGGHRAGTCAVRLLRALAVAELERLVASSAPPGRHRRSGCSGGISRCCAAEAWIRTRRHRSWCLPLVQDRCPGRSTSSVDLPPSRGRDSMAVRSGSQAECEPMPHIIQIWGRCV